MTEQQDNQTPHAFLARVAALLRVDPHVLAASWKNIRSNRHKIVQAATWRDMVGEMPKRVVASAILAVVLIVAAIWGHSFLTATQSRVAKIVLPLKNTLKAAAATARPHPTDTPISLTSAAGHSGLPLAETTPTIAPTPIFVFHTVAAGESLIAIAAKYNVTTESLLVANNIRNPSQLAEGQHLLIPPKDGLSSQKIMTHDVKEGDTLLSIASKYGSSVKNIMAANPGLSEPLPVGAAVAVPIVFLDDNLALNPNAGTETKYYTVQSGDTPLAIAAQYNIPVEILLSSNNIADATRLQVGQTLLIPPHAGVTLDFPVILYELVAGDTLVGIASRFGSSVKDILAINPELNPADLKPGQMVAIPVIFIPKKEVPPPTKATPVPVPPPPINRSLTEQMVNAINAERAAKGLPPYKFALDMAAVALGHAQDMVVRDFVAHVNPDGKGPKDRLADHGIVNILRMGENIQVNSKPADQTVAEAINWFMHSPPHRAGILNKYYTQIGVAAVQNPAGWYYFVIVFAER